MAVQNRVLGRGKLYFAPFLTGTYTPGGSRYIGNTPEVSLNVSSETLDHFSSDGGIREIDDSVTVQTDRKLTFTTDDVSGDNLALFFFGSTSLQTTIAGTVTDEIVLGVVKDAYLQLGISVTNPSGVRGLVAHTSPTIQVIVKDGATNLITYVDGTDYTVDLAMGRLYITAASTIAAGSSIKVTYKTGSVTRERILSGNASIEGALQYIADNPKGTNRDLYIPRVRISPNGDFALKAEKDWQGLPFNGAILKLADREAIYIDGRAY